MIADANAADDGAVLQADVCIVGAGAAGITLATALDARGIDVVLLESGGLEPEADTQRLYDGANVGAPYSPSTSRLRYFGGTTNHWGGLCHEMEDADFVARPWIRDSGWPIRKTDLAPYYDAARAILDLPPALRRFEEVAHDDPAYPRLLGPTNAAFDPLLWLKSPPTRLGTKYRDAIGRSAHVRCWLHANAAEIVVDPTASHVTAIRARTLGGRSLVCTARQYVLGAGGIENARLLLLSDAVAPRGIGNRHDLVGRYFMEHLAQFVGSIVVAPPAGTRGFQEERVQQRAQVDHAGVWELFFGFGTTLDLRTRHRLLGCAINAIPKGAAEGGVDRAVETLVVDPRGTGGAPSNARAYALSIIAERAPNRDSRVFLGDERDALGQRKIVVDIRHDPCDTRSARKSVRAFALALARSGHGRARLHEEDESNLIGLMGHHMGTTRMSDDPTRGVTDGDGRVHGIANLYVAGSSLFVTGSWANPTFTIVALALRQADCLERACRQTPAEVRSDG